MVAWGSLSKGTWGSLKTGSSGESQVTDAGELGWRGSLVLQQNVMLSCLFLKEFAPSLRGMIFQHLLSQEAGWFQHQIGLALLGRSI